MKLHLNKESFEQAITTTAEHFNILEVFVEKDYWVTHVLKNLSQSKFKDKVVFKGGTSLSKAYHIINRFSEDIDLAIIAPEAASGGAIKKMIKEVEVETTKGLTEIEVNGITSKGSKYRKTVFEYPRIVRSNNFGQANDKLLLEINSFADPHPFHEMPIQSMIGEFLIQTDRKEVVEANELHPFNINVLGLERTLAEKILSLVRAGYAENPMNELAARVRHLYDLHFIVKNENMHTFIAGKDFAKIIKNVLADDERNSQFQGDWTKKPLRESMVFADWEKVWGELQNVYHNQFKSLVFDKLPESNEINDSILIIRKAIQ